MADHPLTIEQLLQRDLSSEIEDIIKVSQTDEVVVRREIEEYVPTDNIRREYRDLLAAVASGPSEPSEGIAVWVSGFFGSGKSSFAKNLGYILANPTLEGEPAAELLKRKLDDRATSLQIDSIVSRIQTEVVMFDVRSDAPGEARIEGLTTVLYRVLLSRLGYAEDFAVADLELDLEINGELERFETLFQETHRKAWRTARKLARALPEASRILHLMHPETYPEANSWDLSRRAPVKLSPSELVSRAFDMLARRRPGKALAFVVDELGQYVGYSGDLVEELRAIVERFGQEGRNRVAAGKIPGPTWIVATSQEKLDEVVKAIDDRRIDIPKLQDRFRHRIDLQPADIRQVASLRVLSKNDEGDRVLRELFRAHQGRLNDALSLERSARPTHVAEDDFVQFYPYPPHFIDLSIDIMTGIRLQMTGNIRHLGGSNRTIIKQSYEMLCHEKTHMRTSPVGALATLDKIYDLVESNLPNELLIDMSSIKRAFGESSWEARVAKALTLLEKVRDLPRTDRNVAAVLVDSVDLSAPLPQTQDALKQLEDHGYVRRSEDGFKLQTAQERSWTGEREGYLNPKPRERNEIIREILQQVFSEPALRTHTAHGRTLKVGLAIEGQKVGDVGDIPLSVFAAGASDELAARIEQARLESAAAEGQNRVYWVLTLDAEVADQVGQLFASRQMILKYDQNRARGSITATESGLLAEEKSRQDRLRKMLADRMERVAADGQGMFRGVEYDAADLGRNLADRLQGLYAKAVPQLYEHMALAAVPVKGTEPVEVLRSQNLQALPSVLYSGGEGTLGLIVKQGEHLVVNRQAAVAAEILQYLDREHRFGNRVTGADLSAHFGGFGYGWEIDVLRLVLALLVRGAAVEVTHAGVKFRNASDPRVRGAFENVRSFKAASFAPRAGELDIPTLVKASQQYEDVTGRPVDIDEASIAEAAQTFARDELQALTGTLAVARANRLPFVDRLGAYKESLETLDRAASDDAVRTLAGEGASLKAERDWANRVREATTEEGLGRLAVAREVLERIWPEVQGASDGATAEDVGQARSQMASDDLVDHLGDVSKTAHAVEELFGRRYEQLHTERGEAYLAALERIKALEAYTQVSGMQEAELVEPDAVESITAALLSRGPHPIQRPQTEARCLTCGATMGQLAAEIEAVGAAETAARTALEAFLAPEPAPDGVVTVRLADFFPESLDVASIDAAVEELRRHLLDLLEQQRMIVVQ